MQSTLLGCAVAGLMALATTTVAAQSTPASGAMTNKAAQPPGATASAPADKKPAKAGAQAGPAPSAPK